MPPRSACTVTAAFAQERDAGFAVALIASASDIEARFVRRSVLSERGEIQMVILEASFADPEQSDRVASCMTGAHGVRMRPQADQVDLARVS